MISLLALLAEAPTEEGVSCKVIIYALAGAVITLAGFSARQMLARITDLKEVHDLSSTLDNVVRDEKHRGDTR